MSPLRQLQQQQGRRSAHPHNDRPWWRAYLFGSLILLLAACTEPTIVSVSAPPTLPPVTLGVRTDIAATNTPPATTPPLPPATITPLPTSVPTATATKAPLVVGVPPQWQALVEEALTNPVLAAWAGQLSPGVEAATIWLSNAPGGIPVWRRPLALTVPFTLDWHNLTLAEAEMIIAAGHEAVTVIPWQDMGPQVRALRVDGLSPADPAYPLQEVWSVHSAAGYEPAGTALAAALVQQAVLDPVVQLAAVGDIMLDRALGRQLQQGNLAHPFALVQETLAAADLTVGNLESALGDSGTPAAKSYAFRAPPQAAAALALAGFDVVSLANNHAGDYGGEALQQGIALLQEAGLATIGAGANSGSARAPALFTRHGLTLALLGYVHVPVEAIGGFDTASWTATTEMPGLAWADPALIQADVTAVASEVDLVVVVLHSGYEYVETPSPPQVAAARAAIDAGADLVIGDHAHILQGIEFYGEGVIVYGLGNFAFEIDGSPQTGILNIWLDKDGVRELELVPAIVQFGGQPRLAEPAEAVVIRQRVYYLTTVLGNTPPPD